MSHTKGRERKPLCFQGETWFPWWEGGLKIRTEGPGGGRCARVCGCLGAHTAPETSGEPDCCVL